MTADLFSHHTGAAHLSKLTEEISEYLPEIASKHVPAISDKWLLASNLQKAIRRGLTEAAIGTATRLLSVDERYLWRRLLVIAYEDIGFGDIQVCFDLLKTFRREAMHRQLGAARVAAYFTSSLASAGKSRALCDAIVMLEFNVDAGRLARRCFALLDAELVDAICGEKESMMYRVAALRHICGYQESAYGSYRSVTPARPELMREVCHRLELTEIETTLFVSGQNVSASLNIPLPLIAMLARGRQAKAETVHTFDGKNGILYAALDKHTRIGKKCFSRFAEEAKPIGDFFHKRERLDPVDALGAAVFFLEGASLNRRVVFRQSEMLRRSCEQKFFEYYGVTGENVSELLRITGENLPTLNRIRGEALDAMA